MPAVEFVNLTDWSITVTTNNGSPILQDLKPRKSKNVNKKNMSKDDLKSVSVQKNSEVSKVHITQSDLTKYATVVFKSEEAGNGEKFLRVEGAHVSKLVRYIGRLVGKTVRKEVIAREEGGPNQSDEVPEYSGKKVARLKGVKSEPNILLRR